MISDGSSDKLLSHRLGPSPVSNSSTAKFSFKLHFDRRVTQPTADIAWCCIPLKESLKKANLYSKMNKSHCSLKSTFDSTITVEKTPEVRINCLKMLEPTNLQWMDRESALRIKQLKPPVFQRTHKQYNK